MSKSKSRRKSVTDKIKQNAANNNPYNLKLPESRAVMKMYDKAFYDSALISNAAGIVSDVINGVFPDDSPMGIRLTVGDFRYINGWWTDARLLLEITEAFIGRALRHIQIEVTGKAPEELMHTKPQISIETINATNAQAIRVQPRLKQKVIAMFGEPENIDHDGIQKLVDKIQTENVQELRTINPEIRQVAENRTELMEYLEGLSQFISLNLINRVKTILTNGSDEEGLAYLQIPENRESLKSDILGLLELATTSELQKIKQERLEEYQLIMNNHAELILETGTEFFRQEVAKKMH